MSLHAGEFPAFLYCNNGIVVYWHSINLCGKVMDYWILILYSVKYREDLLCSYILLADSYTVAATLPVTDSIAKLILIDIPAAYQIQAFIIARA